jgi:hypothetical protein
MGSEPHALASGPVLTRVVLCQPPEFPLSQLSVFFPIRVNFSAAAKWAASHLHQRLPKLIRRHIEVR